MAILPTGVGSMLLLTWYVVPTRVWPYIYCMLIYPSISIAIHMSMYLGTRVLLVTNVPLATRYCNTRVLGTRVLE